MIEPTRYCLLSRCLRPVSTFRRFDVLTFVCLVGAFPLAGPAETDLQQELQRDVVFRSLVDELERNKTELRLADLSPPYFLEYQLIDAVGLAVSAELGAITRENLNRSRWLRTDVRAGSYELDNSNFRGSTSGLSGFGGSGSGGASIPIEDDYLALRQAIWWLTDRQYKEAVEQFAEKKAFMAGRMIEDKPRDFSKEEPATCFEDRVELQIDRIRLSTLAKEASSVFRPFPLVKESSVGLQSAVGHKYLANNEGTRIRTSHRRFSLTVTATVQAEDGMELSGSSHFESRTVEGLPKPEALASSCRALAARLVALRSAPPLDAYTGPVLFEAEPMAGLFLRLMGGRFAGGQRPVGSRSTPDDFAKKLHRRILPRFMNVVDDPTQQTLFGIPVMAHYRYDDQGVAARPVTLVESGKLLGLLMSRTPSKEFLRSTGHGRGAFGPRSAPACLLVSGTQTLNGGALRDELLDTAQDEGLAFAIRVASLGSLGSSGRNGRESAPGPTPLEVYKVYSDGREELVRGVELGRVDLKAFKRILAMGDTPYVLNTPGSVPQTIAVPAMLFEELDLAKVDRDFDRPPGIPSPVARSAGTSVP